jgi:hypothetical protein
MASDTDMVEEQQPLSPSDSLQQRPKRRKIETEKVKEAREMEMEAARSARRGRDEGASIGMGPAPPSPSGTLVPPLDAVAEEGGMVRAGVGMGGAARHAEQQDHDYEQLVEEDAPYQPPAGALDGETGTAYDMHRSDKEPKHVLQGTFVKDLIPMMIGFGDDESPSIDTVEFVEDALVSYSAEILKSALELSRQRGRVRSTGKPSGPPLAEDVVTVVRKDPRKVKRIEELLIMQQEIKVAQDTIEKQEDLETLAHEHEEQ